MFSSQDSCHLKPIVCADGPPSTTVIPLAKPVHPKPGNGQISATIPLRTTTVDVTTLCKVVWGILLARYAGTVDIAFGYYHVPAPPSGSKAAAKDLSVCTLCLDPTTKLVAALGTPLTEPNHPLRHHEWALPTDFQGKLETILAIEDAMFQECEPNAGINTLSAQSAMTRATLVVTCRVDRGCLTVHIAFNQSQVTEGAVQGLGWQFCTVAPIVAKAAEGLKLLTSPTIANVTWVSKVERQRLLQFAGTISHPDAVSPPVHHLVSEWASRTPAGVALEYEGRTVTYAEFDCLTSALAHRLVHHCGARPEVRIALLLPKSIEFFVALFAVLKSGAAYIPIDPEYPEERIRYILEDGAASLILAKLETRSRLPTGQTCPVLLVDTLSGSVPDETSTGTPLAFHHSQPADLAYIIYTSGTTGQPKGVMVEHGNLSSFAAEPTHLEFYRPGNRELLAYAIGFDALLWPTLKSLCYGGTLVLPGTDLLSDLASAHTTSVTPSFLARLCPADFPMLRGVVSGGEPCTRHLVDTWSRHCHFSNAYGPSETTVANFSAALEAGDPVTVGRPTRNVLAYIVDENLDLVPVGAPGQLLIGGLGVARGYCNLPDLTAQKFIANPFGPGRVYLTGDKARWLLNGHVDILGRLDHQIKLRGFRIELEEVEAASTSYSTVQLAVATVQADRLVLFVEPESVNTAVLLDHLRTRLTKFMMPDHVVPVARLPLTANGKVDRRALSEFTVPTPVTTLTEPHGFTDLELRLREAWAQVLQLPAERIGPSDDFFRIGGDSISAILLVSKCQQLGYKAAVPLIYEYRQLRALTARLIPLATATSKTNQRQVQGPVDLTPIQRWFFTLAMRNLHHFNQSFTLRVGPFVTVAHIRQALVQLTNHHDILRARFHRRNETEWEQNIPSAEAAAGDFFVTETTVAEADYANLILKVQSSLNLTDGPVMAACLIHSHDEPSCSRLFWTIHHALVDLVSWRVLMEDLQTLLTGGQLPPKTLSFQTWCSQLDDYARTLTADAWPVQSMTVDNRQLLPPPEVLDPVPTAARLSISHEFDREFTTRLLLQLAPQWRVTPRDMLLATFARAYCQALGTTQVSFVMEGHGREPWLDAMDVSRTVGWFTALYPLVLDVPLGSSVLATLHHTKEAMQQIPNRGLPYSLLRHMPRADLAERSKLVAKTPKRLDVQFNYLGRFGGTSSGGEAVSIEWDDRFGLHDFAPNDHVVYDLNPMPLVNQDRLRLVMEYNPQVYGGKLASQLISLWRQGLENLCSTPAISAQPIFTRFDVPLLQPTEQEFGALIAELKRRDISVSDIEDILPCSPMQGSLLTATLKDRSAYLVQTAIRLTGNMNLDRFRRSWDNLTQRHSILRTVFLPSTSPSCNGFAQIVLHNPSVAWTLDKAPLLSLPNFFVENRGLGFDMLRLMVRIHISPTEHPKTFQFVLTIHHALIDGWSLPLLLEDLCRLYTSPTTSAEPAGPPFRRVIEQVTGQDEAAAREFWVEYLRGVQPTPAPMIGMELTGERGLAEHRCTLAVHKPDLLQAAQRFGVTLSTLLRAAYALVLGRYLGRDDFIIGFTVSGRNLDVPGITNVVGPCLNMIPLRFRLTDQSLSDWFQQIQTDTVRMMPFEHTGRAKINSWCNSTVSSPLFHILNGFENFPQLDLETEEVSIELGPVHEFTEYPLDSDFIDKPEAISFVCAYERAFCQEACVVQMVERIDQVLTEFASATADTKISSVLPSLSVAAPSNPERRVVADGFQVPLATLDRYLAKKNVPSPFSVVTHDGRIVTRTSATEAGLETLRTLYTDLELPVSLTPATIISLDAFPHLSSASEGDLVRLGEAYLHVSDEMAQHTVKSYEKWWLMITCMDLLSSAGYKVKPSEAVWTHLRSRPNLLLQLEYRVKQRFGITLDTRTILACDCLITMASAIEAPGPLLPRTPTLVNQSTHTKSTIHHRAKVML